MTLESIGKLCEAIDGHAWRDGREPEPFDEACDEIEREVAERFMELPVDADGVPIRIGDGLIGEVTLTVAGVGDGIVFDRDGNTHNIRWVHHRKPTVEDVLDEFSKRVLNSGHQWGLDERDVIAEYADKLREAVRAE